jgi:hypothetical protein
MLKADGGSAVGGAKDKPHTTNTHSTKAQRHHQMPRRLHGKGFGTVRMGAIVHKHAP